MANIFSGTKTMNSPKGCLIHNTIAVIFTMGTAIFNHSHIAFAEADDEPELPVDSERTPGQPEPAPSKPGKNAKTKSQKPQKQANKLTFFTGIGLGIPEVIPIEASVKFGRRFALRLYVAPPVINVKMPVYVPEYSTSLI